MKNWRRFALLTSLCAAFIGVCAPKISAGAYSDTGIPTEKTGDLYVSVNGTADGDGSKGSPMDFLTAVNAVSAGNTVWVEAGTYNMYEKYNETIVIEPNNSGLAGAYKNVCSYGGDVIFDFVGMEEANPNRGVSLEGSYWHFYDIDICNAGDNGMIMSGSHNILELCQFYANHDSGLQISRTDGGADTVDKWPSYNLVLNCTAFNNKDEATNENADGFAAKLTCGEGNIFDGCMSYCNSDDGWDLYAKPETGSIGVVTIKNSIAFGNGKLTNGEGSPNGDMNGFKLGGSNKQCPTPHVVINCLAFNNGACGFTDNGNGGALKMTNCTSANNGVFDSAKSNYACYRTSTDAAYTNILSYAPTKGMETDSFIGNLTSVLYHYKNLSSNGACYWIKDFRCSDTSQLKYAGSEKADYKVNASDFVSTTLVGYDANTATYSTEYHTLLRREDGSIDLDGLYEVKETSALYKAGLGGKYLGARFSEGESDTETTINVYSFTADDVKAGTYTSDFTVGGNGFFTISASADKTVTVDAGSAKYNGMTISQRVNLGGAGLSDGSYRTVNFTTKGSGSVVIYAMSSGKSEGRNVCMYKDGEKCAEKEIPGGSNITEVTFDIPSEGTYSITSEAKALYIYYVKVSENVISIEPTPTETPEPTKTPAPTNTPSVTETPVPTNTPSVTETPAPTNTPSATETPAPTETPSHEDDSVTAFVERLYTNVLDRGSDKEGIEYWAGLLNAKSTTGLNVGYEFVFSKEFKEKNINNEAFIEMLYKTFMNREGDEAGRAYWLKYLEAGFDREYIFANFVTSKEYTEICEKYGIIRGEISDNGVILEALSMYHNQNLLLSQYIARCYDKIQEREFEAEGMEFWCGQIINNEQEAKVVAEFFVLSEEFVNKNKSDEEFIDILYNAFFGRQKDDAGNTFWLGVLGRGEKSREDVLKDFSASKEFAEIVGSFGL